MNHIFSLDQRRHPCWMNFTGEKYFGNFAFDAFCARSNMKIIWLSKDLRFKFGNAIFVFGYATIGNNKFHPPTPCLGIRDLLHRKGFDILLLDEYRTLSRCPLCKSEVKPFKHSRTPCPWWGNNSPDLVHGLLQVGSEECQSLMVKNVSGIVIYLQHSTFGRLSMDWEADKADLFTLLEGIGKSMFPSTHCNNSLDSSIHLLALR